MAGAGPAARRTIQARSDEAARRASSRGLRDRWSAIRESLWAIPSVMTLAMAALATAVVWLDRRMAGSGPLARLALGVDGSRGVLSTVAGSLITVTGVVFSITIVVLQLASSQYTPRVLRSFRADRASQVVLGAFIGTFTYALIVLASIRSEIADRERFVPTIGVTAAIVLSLGCVALLIFFINHISRLIQAEVIVERVTREALAVVDLLCPDELGAHPSTSPPPTAPGGRAIAVVRAERGGYLQEVREPDIVQAALRVGATVRMEVPIGDFLLPGEAIASVWGGSGAAGCTEAVRRAFVVGPERTNRQDVERGIIELTDIAVRALSPGINDPTTALVCIDRITEVLLVLGSRRCSDRHWLDPDGELRLVEHPIRFDHVVQISFAQVRHHGAANPAVAARLARSLARLAQRLPEDRAAPVREELGALVEAAERSIPRAADRAAVLAAAGD